MNPRSLLARLGPPLGVPELPGLHVMGVEGVGGAREACADPTETLRVAPGRCWPGHRGRVFLHWLASAWHDPCGGRERSSPCKESLQGLLAGIYKELIGKHTSSSFLPAREGC